MEDRKAADASSPRELLEDVEFELAALLSDFTKAANVPNPAAADGWWSALQEIERTLAAQGCTYAKTEACLPFLSSPRRDAVSVC